MEKFYIDKCSIFRYVQEEEDRITSHELKEIASGARCRLVQKSTKDLSDTGRTKIISTYSLLLPKKTDLKAGDRIQVNSEEMNGRPVRYEAGKPAYPDRHHMRVVLSEEEER